MTTGQSASNKSRFYLALIAVIFIGPVIVAWALYSSKSFIPETISNGHLIASPLQIQKLPLTTTQGQKITLKDFEHKWLMLYINPKTCGKNCEKILYKMRQLRKSFGKDSPRIKRVILTLSNQTQPNLQQLIQAKYPGTLHIETTAKDLSGFLQPLPSQAMALNIGYLYLVDPLGNVMMSYPTSEKPRGIYTDLKRLLKASRIG